MRRPRRSAPCRLVGGGLGPCVADRQHAGIVYAPLTGLDLVGRAVRHAAFELAARYLRRHVGDDVPGNPELELAKNSCAPHLLAGGRLDLIFGISPQAVTFRHSSMMHALAMRVMRVGTAPVPGMRAAAATFASLAGLARHCTAPCGTSGGHHPMEDADRPGATPAQITLAWLPAKPIVSSVIVGARRMGQSQDSFGAAAVRLTDDEVRRSDEVSAMPLPYPGRIAAAGPGRQGQGRPRRRRRLTGRRPAAGGPGSGPRHCRRKDFCTSSGSQNAHPGPA